MQITDKPHYAFMAAEITLNPLTPTVAIWVQQ